MKEKSLLWELSINDGLRSYVFGTIHINNDLAFKHAKKAINAIQQCDQFFAEINLDEAQNQLSPAVYFLPDDKVLKDYLSPKKLKKIRKSLLKSFDLDIRPYEKLLPIMLTNKISESVLNSKGGRTLDQALWDEARRLRLETDGLETLEEQLDILGSLDIKDQLQSLVAIAKNTSKIRKTTEKLAICYQEQDIYKLHRLSRKSLGKMRQSLLYNRNEIMSNRIITKLDRKSFFAIGTGHLAGNKGVLALLKRQGISINAVKG